MIARRNLLAGMFLVALAWVALLVGALARGRELPLFSVGYNLPITLAFGALAVDLAVRAIALGWARAFKAEGPLILAWGLGGVLLFLRLATKSIDVSGHMAWAILMAVQCIVEGAPRWFTVFVWCIAGQVLVLKLFVLGGKSGQWGLVAGGLLGAILIALDRRTRRELAG